MFNIWKYLFLRKANYNRINTILKNENFIYTPQDIENLLKGNQKGIRYGNTVLERTESNGKQKCFLKIMLDGRLETFKLFSRQVNVADALYKDKEFTSPTMAVIKSSLDSPVPYTIFETREDGENFGFLHDKQGFYEKFNEKNIYNLVDSIYAFHSAGQSIDPKIWKHAREIKSDISHYKKEVLKNLNKVIIHKSVNGELVEKPVKELLAQYIGFENIEEHAMNILEENWKYVNSSKRKDIKYLVHADMQIDNLYKHKDGTFELLDFEWVGHSNNPITAIMYDYGNLRSRAWSSPSFQSYLDKAMLEVGQKYHADINIIKAGMNLGILRSSLMMSRYHLDFINTVEKDKRSEKDYQRMYPLTLTSLIQIIKK